MSIYEQLQEKCGCGCEETETTKSNIDELVHLVSLATCWAGESGCGTFLLEDREEIADLPHLHSCPDDCSFFLFKPFFKPYVLSSFTFTIVITEELKETTIPVLEDDFMFSQVDKGFRIRLPYTCTCRNACECKKDYKLIARYVAGYDEIPQCVLPVFCSMIDLINKKNECGCDCDCDCEKPNTENETDYGNYTKGDALSNEIVNSIGPLLVKEYKEMLGSMSLCENIYNYWSVIV